MAKSTFRVYMGAIVLMVAVALMLPACQMLVPKTFNERLATGYATVTTVRQTATTLLTSQAISSKDAQNIQNQANAARDGLDVARDIRAAFPGQAEDKLTATIQILTALQKYVESKGAH